MAYCHIKQRRTLEMSQKNRLEKLENTQVQTAKEEQEKYSQIIQLKISQQEEKTELLRKHLAEYRNFEASKMQHR